MKQNEILLPPGVKSINELNTLKIQNNIKSNIKDRNNNIGSNIDKNEIQAINLKDNSSTSQNISNIPDNIEFPNQDIKPVDKINKNINNGSLNSNDNNSEDIFEDLSIINDEAPRKIKPYVRKRNKRDVLKIISKKVVPNEQLLKNPIISTLNTVNTTDNTNVDNININNHNINNNNLNISSQQNLKYLNADGSMSSSREENIRKIISNTHNKKDTYYNIYNHKDYPARRIKQTSFLFHRVGAGVSDEKAQQSLQTHKRKMEGVQNAIIKKIKESRN